ncbi:MAG: hypothetical protein ABFS03_07325, partial [Chloroflexota bacterium]
MKTKINRGLIIILGLLIVLLSTACSAAPDEHIWLKSPGWSRALFLGTTAFSDSLPLALDEDGSVYTLMTEKDELSGETYFRVLALDRAADMLWERTLSDHPLQQPDNPKLITVDRGLQLFWIDGEQLYTLLLQSDGSAQGDPVLLSED